MDIAKLTERRRTKDGFFAASSQSPLHHHARHGFAGQAYYDPNPGERTYPGGGDDG